MPENRDLSCRCGATRWSVAAIAPGCHVECYCADCQSFARHLRADEVWLDPDGGTESFHTLPRHVRFTAGQENLRALRLGPKGLIRWYAGCCDTPVANTLATPRLPFVGLVLRPGQAGFGPLVTKANTGAARRPVRGFGKGRAIAGLLLRAAGARLTGRHRPNPFFDAAGAPTVTPRILTLAERNAARPPKAP